jgi:hypothetical protein
MSEAVVGSDSRALQAGGHRFDPGHVHQNFTPLLCAIYAATSASDFTEVFFGAFGAIKKRVKELK